MHIARSGFAYGDANWRKSSPPQRIRETRRTDQYRFGDLREAEDELAIEPIGAFAEDSARPPHLTAEGHSATFTATERYCSSTLHYANEWDHIQAASGFHTG
jgi:hypothetical protein